MLWLLNTLFEVTIEIDGSLNGLSSETIQLQYLLETMRKAKVD